MKGVTRERRVEFNLVAQGSADSAEEAVKLGVGVGTGGGVNPGETHEQVLSEADLLHLEGQAHSPGG